MLSGVGLTFSGVHLYVEPSTLRHYLLGAQSDPYQDVAACPKWIMGLVERRRPFVRLQARRRAGRMAENEGAA